MRCSPVSRRRTLPDAPKKGAPLAGAEAHFRALESLYDSAPINEIWRSRLEIVESGFARIHFDLDKRYFHAAGAVHGTSYFKMLDDAAFYAANSLVSDRFLLTTGFNLLFTRPMTGGSVTAEGRWVSGQRRVFVAEARLIDAEGEEAARGTGTFMKSRIALSSLDGYRQPA
ncbi:PaaI family thioesterase [Parasphingopyxis algicola]|uniref:PaaI family thioesterase n=1 Tax=Parasphingopyxis algicola TaxID=2026624 RepID=UPI0015A38483|nr:PaaI family thioesterase [Parasphingopyxis algicola]QLC25631.1 PaaI family thioesterase [Parasphingopyxis algicola]